MADVERNKQLWGTDYDWKDLGEEWSAHYGGSDMQWHGSILPHIQQFLSESNADQLKFWRRSGKVEANIRTIWKGIIYQMTMMLLFQNVCRV